MFKLVEEIVFRSDHSEAYEKYNSIRKIINFFRKNGNGIIKFSMMCHDDYIFLSKMDEKEKQKQFVIIHYMQFSYFHKIDTYRIFANTDIASVKDIALFKLRYI